MFGGQLARGINANSYLLQTLREQEGCQRVHMHDRGIKSKSLVRIRRNEFIASTNAVAEAGRIPTLTPCCGVGTKQKNKPPSSDCLMEETRIYGADKMKSNESRTN